MDQVIKVAEFLQISQSAATRKIKKFIEGKKTLDKKATFVSIDKKAMYINGEWITLQEQIEVNNPATKEIFATVPKGGVTEAKQAVDAAHEAFKTWSKLATADRATKLKSGSCLLIKIKKRSQRL